MSIRVVPFGAFEGFNDQPVPGTNYYSQGFTPSEFGAATQYSIINKRDSSSVPGMSTITGFTNALGSCYAYDQSGNILKEGTGGNYDFSIVHSVAGAGGFGILGDQYGRLFYAAGSTPTQIGMYDGSSWNDSFQTSLANWSHPMDTYEDLVLFGNKSSVAVLFSDNTWNPYAFQLPSIMTISCLSSGPAGILIGANIGNQGAIILWDGNSLRAKTPWKWTNGAILSMERYGDVWIVRTQREVLITNGVTVTQLFGTLDDPMGLSGYDSNETFPNTMKIINDNLVFTVSIRSDSSVRQFGRLKAGVYFYSLSRHGWSYLPVGTGNTVSAEVGTVFADVNFGNRLMIGYTDMKTGVAYVAQIADTPPSTAVYVSESLGLGRIKYQRVFFGPTDKSLEAVILNVSVQSSSIVPANNESFYVSLKVYNFTRQLWGHNLTTASRTNHAEIRVDGTNAAYTDAQIGDEVTILEGVNAGQIAHISSIANDGTNTETWTLDVPLVGQTESNVNVQVQPFIFVKKQTISDLATQNRIYFNVSGIRGKQFLLKLVYESINMPIEMQTSYFVFDDLGSDQT